ncbi:PHD finger protein 21B-like [Scleropages formosus]|uniref:PHD finger protein 21B-like n=1 Tax=Scleropages formosus TaxID=113540 RepID=A0A8C9S7B9_SCLFO|nr:PHD finger protein 21B-like [Scleropages formosus]
MELQGLQETLKVEIQCHQKLALRGCPVGSAKPISLIKQPTQNIAFSVVPAKTPVSMVTAHINGQKAVSSEPLQAAPVNLQMANKVASSSLSLGRRATELPQSQVLGTLTAVPIKVPHISSMHRLVGQAPTVLPQVRPKTLIPDSLPHIPGQEQVSGKLTKLEKTPAAVSAKSQGSALPTTNNTTGPVELHNGQATSVSMAQPPAVSTAISGGGVAYAIISAASEAVKVQPLLFSTDNKVIIIQPQATGSPQKSPGPLAEGPTKEPMTPPALPVEKKKEEVEKIAFMVALGLVTTDHLEEIQSKRQERKRRSTANPAYSGQFEPERKRHTSNYLNNPLFLSTRDTEDLCWKDELEHDERCVVCKEDGELLSCHKCPRTYHLDCLHPALKVPPKGSWMCPKCQKKVLNKDNLSWPQNFVQSYVTHKRVREEEKKKLIRRNSELKKECALLEQQDQKLSESLTKCMDMKSSLLGKQKETRASLDRLKALICLIQRDQMIQVTMTATTTTGASLLSLPWIKPSSTVTVAHAGTSMVFQKSVAQTEDNN